MLTSGLTSSATDEWATPQDLFAKFYTKEQDGLKQDWGGLLYGAIRHTAERLANGFRNAPNTGDWQSC